MGKYCDDMFICQGKNRSKLSLSCRLKIDYGKCERGRGESPFERKEGSPSEKEPKK